MLLYAGKASISSFKYFIFLDIVKILKQWSQSAGNTFILNSGTSETIRDNSENIKKISIHVPTHLKPLNDEQFGHYLAGLIDGDGHFSSQQQLVIVFSSPDVQSAYYIKEIIGFGHVKKVNSKNAYFYIISNKDGIIKAINLINGKLRTLNKFNQVINNILAHSKYREQDINFEMNKSNDFNNHWIAGFSDADASFQIKIVNRVNKPRPEIRLNFQIDQKDKDVLLLIKDVFGGNISFQNPTNNYRLNISFFGSVRKIIKYFDTFHLQSRKHINYLKWRKAYILIQEGNFSGLLEKKFNVLFTIDTKVKKSELNSYLTNSSIKGLKSSIEQKRYYSVKLLKNNNIDPN